ncbi:MAG: response regulator [Acidobacteria bacterium]|nr:response regulator [Acidobacteriota bacterium]
MDPNPVSLGTASLTAALSSCDDCARRPRLYQAASLLEQEWRILELIAGGAPLPQILDALTAAIEQQAPECLCSILLLDEERRRLLHGSAPSLPASYSQQIHGIEIGPAVGSCGSAAYNNENTIVEDIETDLRWAAFKDLALSYGLRACWSVPIRDSHKRVLGTFALYHRVASRPSPEHLQLVETGAHLAGIAIENRCAEELLRRNAERMELAEKAAGFGIWELDIQTERTVVSQGILTLLGLSPSEALNVVADWRQYLHPEDRRRVDRWFRQATTGAAPCSQEFRMVRKDGVVRWFRLKGKVNCDPSGKPVGITGALKDITEEREMLLRLEQAKIAAEVAARAKSQFLANMSHELRTPLHGLIGSIDLLLLDSALTPEQRDYVRTLRVCGQSLSRIVNDILDFSKIEAGKVQLERVAFHLPVLVQEVLTVLLPEADAKGLKLRPSIGETVPPVLLGDPQRLRQVLLNLVTNGIKFTDRGEVSIRVTCQDSSGGAAWLLFEVADTGIGIPPEAQAGLFEPFTQADSSTTRRYGGTGLGLAISRRLIRLMDGDIGFSSRPGHGSTFRFTVPFGVAAHQDASDVREREFCPGSTRSLRILLAEDSSVNQLVASRLLERMGHRVDVASDGRAAVDAVASQDYDVVLMDCQMPVMDGYAAAHCLRERGLRVPIIALTANAMPQDRQRCLDAGMNDYLAKPISIQRLHQALESVTSLSAPVAAI